MSFLRTTPGVALLSLDPISALAEANKDALDTLMREACPSDARLTEMIANLAVQEGIIAPDEPPEDAPEPQIDRAEELPHLS